MKPNFNIPFKKRNTISNIKPFWEDKDKSITKLGINLIPRYIKIVIWILGIDTSLKKSFNLLGYRIKTLCLNSGTNHGVPYLKECLRITQKFISGERVNDALEFRLGIQYGLPSIIPGDLRILIRKRDPRVIRAVLTILTLFRVMKCKPKVKIESITDPFDGKCDTLPDFEVMEAVSPFKLKLPYPQNTFHLSFAAGPNTKPSILGMSIDALALMDKPKLLDSIRILSESFGGLV
jgi:hypothetical protein